MRRLAVLLLPVLLASCSDGDPVIDENPDPELVKALEESVAEEKAEEEGTDKPKYAQLADEVDAGGSYSLITELALMGNEALPVGPRVLTWAKNHPNKSYRPVAVRALGAIGYHEARVPLEGFLHDRTDWRNAYSATKSLAQLGDAESIPALEKAAREHWFPPVRESARNAVEVIRGTAELTEHGQSEIMRLTYYAYVPREQLTLPKSDIPGLKKAAPSDATRVSAEEFAAANGELYEEIKKLSPQNESNKESWLSIASVSTLPVGGTTYYGVGGNDYGGALVARTVDGKLHFLEDDSIEVLVKWKDAVWMAAGVRTYGNRGELYRVAEDHGKFEVTENFVLPGKPTAMWVTEDNKLVVECLGGTMVFESMVTFDYHGSGQKNE